MATGDEDVEIVPFEEVMVEEVAPQGRTIEKVHPGEPSTSKSRKKTKDKKTPSSSDRAQIDKEIEQIKQQVQREKETTSGGSRIDATAQHIFQFTVTLLRGKPARKVWRRIQVPANYTFHEFHIAIQKAMGWKSAHEDFHLHRFVVYNVETKKEDTIVMTEYTQLRIAARDENLVRLKDYFTVLGHKGIYVYDLSTLWTHELIFEDSFLPVQGEKYPKCVCGEKACPQDDGVPLTPDDYCVDPDWFDPLKCFQD